MKLSAYAILPAIAALSMASAQTPALAQSDQELAAENFLQADTDGDDALSKSEFTTLINLNADDDLGRASTVKRFGRYDMAFGRADANADGSVTKEELRALADQQ